MSVLDGKVAIVTGSNRGIGRGIARGFARAGASLALAARDAALLDDAADEFRGLGAQVAAFPTDVTDEDSVNALIDRTLAQFGQLDVLVNNAGIANHAPLVDMTLADWQATIDVNLTGPFLCARAALRVMAPAGRGAHHQRGQHLVAARASGVSLLQRLQVRTMGPDPSDCAGRPRPRCVVQLPQPGQYLGGAADRQPAARGRGTDDDRGRTGHRRRDDGRHAGPREHAGSHGAARRPAIHWAGLNTPLGRPPGAGR